MAFATLLIIHRSCHPHQSYPFSSRQNTTNKCTVVD